MRDVAREARVVVSTVSKALRSDPSISPEQCRRIQEIAHRIGYRPDPEVSKLMAHLHHYRRRTDPHSIAWIDFWESEPVGHVAYDIAAALAGAQKRARELGYEIEVHKPALDKITPERLSRILTARSQWGIIVPPVPEWAMHLEWDLSPFAAVTIGTSLREPVMHRIAPSHFHGATLAFERMRQKGYGRIGLAMSSSMNERVEGKWLGGFVAACQHVPEKERIPPLIFEERDREAVTRWIRETKPDALLIAEEFIAESVRKVPKRQAPALAWLAPFSGRKGDPAIDFKAERLGSVALDMVVGQIHRNERGLPAIPHTVLLESAWTE